VVRGGRYSLRGGSTPAGLNKGEDRGGISDSGFKGSSTEFRDRDREGVSEGGSIRAN